MTPVSQCNGLEMFYKDSRFWWVLAAASDIGWGLQVPPGTIINIPNINQVSIIVG